MERDAKRCKTSAFQTKLRTDHCSKSVYFEGYYYATLDFAQPDGPDGPCENGPSADFRELPGGWELAPNEEYIVEAIIAKHTWQASLIVLADGTGYAAKGHHTLGAGERWGGKGEIEKSGNSYRLRVLGSLRILVRAKDPSIDEAHAYRSQLTTDLWTAKRFTDCIIAWADSEESYHRAVLAAASPVFEKMLSSSMEEGVQKRISIKDVSAEVGHAMIRFMYQGELDKDFKQPADLLRAAHMYQVQALIPVSAKLLLDKLDVNCVADAVRAVKLLRDNPEMEGLWSAMMTSLKENPSLLSAAMMSM